MVKYSLGQLADQLGAVLERGNPAVEISGLATLQEAGPEHLSFLANAHYRKYLTACRAGAVLLKPEDAANYSGVVLVHPDPYAAYAQASHLFETRPRLLEGVHPSAIVAKDAHVDSSARIGPYVVIESGAWVGAGVEIGAHGFIGARTRIGAGSRLAPRVTLCHDIRLGERVVIQPGAVIGGDGFGFAQTQDGWRKIAQIGGVCIGDDVEIGANTTIDRGALADTVIANGAKLDNQIQIAHNVHIGEHSALAACVGISGSTKIGQRCMVAGGVGMVGHIDVCDDAFITGMTMVTRSITEPGAYSSGTAMQPAADWKKSAARIRQLDEMARRLRQLEKGLAAVASKDGDDEVSGT